MGDPNLSDGQGNCNGTRTSAAGTLATWLESDPTSTGVTNYLILGDLNAYAQEDPVDTLRARGFVNLHDETEHTYVYNGQYGSLDYALANASLQENVTEAHVWHINSEVSPMWSYTESGDNFVADAYRSSDHDPVMVGLKFEKEVVLASSIKKDYSSQLDYSGEPVLVTYTSENVTENSTLLWSATKDGVALSLENNTSETFTFTYREEGEYVISLTETLGEQSLTVSTDKITVLEKIIEPKPELNPSIKKDYSSQLDYSGEAVVVTYTSENVTENSTLLWSATKDGVALSLENNTSEILTFTYREEGEYVISLTETLGDQNLTVSTEKITVLEKIIEPKPELNPSIKKDYSNTLDVESGKTLSVTYTAEGISEGSQVQWSVSKDSKPVTVKDNTSETFTFTYEEPADYVVSLTEIPSMTIYTKTVSTEVIKVSENKNTILSSPEEKNSLSAFPNPTTGKINFSEKISGALFSLNGLLLERFENKNTLDLSTYPKGFYILKSTEGVVIKVLLK